MRKKTLREILEACQKSGSLDELLNALNNNDYVEDTAGKVVKIKFYKDSEGNVKSEVLSYCDYRDIKEMSLSELEAYYDELQDQYDELEGEEPEDTDEEEGFTLTVKIGRAELIQILDNLITNANKHGFTDPNRMDYEIRLTTEVVTKGTPKLLLKVANNGDPVSRSLQLEKLFTWGGSNGNGTGLGCWQAKDLAEHYNGTLTYQEHSNDENGFVCEFTLSLPLHFD